MRSLRLRKTAQAEIEDAFEWYGHQSATAAVRFLVALDEALAEVRERPEKLSDGNWDASPYVAPTVSVRSGFQDLGAND